MDISNLFSLKGKTAIVTGGERGIGLEIAAGVTVDNADTGDDINSFLVGDAVMSCYEKEGAADDKRQALRDDVLRPVWSQRDDFEFSDDVFHIPYRFIP